MYTQRRSVCFSHLHLSALVGKYLHQWMCVRVSTVCVCLCMSKCVYTHIYTRIISFLDESSFLNVIYIFIIVLHQMFISAL